MSYQIGWEPQWQLKIRGRGPKPSYVLFALIDGEVYAIPVKSGGPDIQIITIDEFNLQYQDVPHAVELVALAMRRARAQRLELPQVMTAASLLQAEAIA